MLKGTKRAGKVHQNSSRHVPGCKTVVCSAAGESNSFGVEVGLPQGSALSPYMFLLLMDVLTDDVIKDVPGSMMFAYDNVLCGDDETDTTEYWRPGGEH